MGEAWMTVVGGGMEMIGFGLIVWQLVRVQRQEFGTPQLVHRVRARVRKLLGKPPITVSAGASLEARFNIEGRGTVRKAMGPDVEDRLAALEHNVAAVDSDFGERVGALKVNANGRYVLRKVGRKELPPLPDFHALRHGAAMDCDDAEEARDLLRHKNSNVTRAVYRAHVSDKRREALRAKMETRHAVLSVEANVEAPDRTGTHQTATGTLAEVVSLRG